MAFETRSRVKDYLIFGLVGLVLVFAGLWIGMKVENSAMKKQAQKDANISTKIAVVNQDMGVTYNNQKVNYSETFIESLGSDFVLVSPQVAAAGLEDGTYGAIITFPSNLSSSVVSINNQNPEQVSLSYVINPNLTGDKYVEVFEKIHNAQGSISDQMTYMYLTSILQEVHEAQDAIDDIYANNDEDVAEAKKLALTEFLKYLDLGDLKYEKPVWVELDINAVYGNDARTLADTLSGYYTGIYGSLGSDYATLKTNQNAKLDTLQQNVDDWSDWNADLKAAYDEDTDELKQYIADLEAYTKRYTERMEVYPFWLASKEQGFVADPPPLGDDPFDVMNPNDPFTMYFRRMENYPKWVAYNDDPSTYPIINPGDFDPSDAADADVLYFVRMENYPFWLASKEPEFVADPVNDPFDPEDATDPFVKFYTNYETWLASKEPDYEPDPNPAPGTFDPTDLTDLDVIEFESGLFPQGLTFTYKTDADWAFQFDGVYAAPPVDKDNDIDDVIQDVRSGLNTDFDPTDYVVDQDMVDGYVESYKKLQEALTQALDKSQTTNLATLSKYHQEYNKYVSEMRGDITDAYSDASDKLDKSLETFMAVKNDNSRDTKEKLDNLSGMLPYSRVNGNVNKTVVEFATTPIYVTEGASGMQEVAEVNTSGTHLLILIIALILAIVSLVVIFTNANQKKRREFASEPRRATAFFRDK